MNKVSESELFNRLTDTDKILFLLYDTDNLTKNELVISCYPVTLVTSVTQKKQGNQGNNSNRVTGKAQETFKVYLNRLFNKNLITKDESIKPFTYSLTINGKDLVKGKYLEYQEEINKLLYRKEIKNKVERQINSFKSYFEQKEIKNKIIEHINKEKNYFIIDVLELATFDFELTDELIDDPEETLKVCDIAFKKITEFEEITNFGFYFTNLPKDTSINITNIRARDLNKLRVVVGEITSRSQSSLTVTYSRFNCPSCGNIIPILQLDQVLKQPTRCGCGRKGKFKILDQKIIDSLRLTINDLYENLTQAEVPEDINAFLDYDNFGYERFAEGDRVRLICIPLHIPIYTKQGQSVNLQKVLKCVGLEKLEDDFTKVEITENDEYTFNLIKKDPIKWHKEVLFNDLHDIDLPSKIAILSLYGELNVLNLGSPGCGKSELIKRISSISLRGKFCDCTTSTSSGIIGTVSKNAFTGKYSVDGGVFRPMSPFGKVAIDEINRDSENSLQKVLLGVMQNRRLNINKAGSRLDVECIVNILSSANVLNPPYREHKTEFDNFGIMFPLWDRFDFQVYFTNKLDFGDIGLLTKLLGKNSQEWKINSKDHEILVKYQIKARSIDVVFSNDDLKNLGLILNQFYMKVDKNISHRALTFMKKFIIAICKLNLRDHPIKKDFIFMTDLILQLQAAKRLFLEQELDIDNNLIIQDKINNEV